MTEEDPINHPPHYTSHPSGIECITVTEHMNFNLGNAMKYIWRSEEKGNALADLEKARWYISRELERLRRCGLPIKSANLMMRGGGPDSASSLALQPKPSIRQVNGPLAVA